MNNFKGVGSLLLCGLLYGLYGIFVRVLQTQQLGTFQQIFLRNTSAFMLALLAVFLLKTKWSVPKSKRKLVFFYCIPYPLSIIFLTLAFLHTQIAVAVFAMYSSSIALCYVIGYVFFKEKLTKLKILSAILLFVGLAFFAMPFSTKSVNIGLVYGLLAGVFAGINVGMRKFLGNHIERFVLITTQMLGGIVITILFLLFFHQTNFPPLSSLSVLISLLFGLVVVIICYLSLVGFQYLDINVGAIVVSSELIFAPLFAILFFKEIPNAYQIEGGACIIGAIVIANIKR